MSKKETFIIAEIGQAHDGSLGILHSYIDAVAETGVNAIKFQTHIAESESSEFEPFRVKFSLQDKTRYDYWKRMEFSENQWIQIKKHCEEVGLEFLSSPFSNRAVDLLERLNIKRYKIGSGEVNNYLLLKKVALTGKPIILSSGMSSMEEVDSAIAFIKKMNKKISVLQCSSKYPSEEADIGLNLIMEFKERYGVPIGLSDHSGTIYPGIAAAALGAEIIEVHVVFNKMMFGPDTSSSLTISELKELVKGVRFIDKSNNHPVDKTSNEQYSDVKMIFEKSLSVNTNLEAGDFITFEVLDAKKPTGYGIKASKFEEVIGKKLIKSKKAFEFLKEGDLE